MSLKIIAVCTDSENTELQAKRLIFQALKITNPQNIQLAVFNKTPQSFLNGFDTINITTSKKDIDTQDMALCLKKAFENQIFDFILFEHSIKALETAAIAAGSMNIPVISQINKIDEGPLFTKQIFNSGLEIKIKPTQEKYILTLMCSQDKIKIPDTEAGNTEIKIESEKPKSKIIKKDSRQEPSSLDQAKIILSAGRGFKEKGDLDKIFELSGLIPDSAVGCSRPLVDNKMLEYSRQVGITGRIVKPKIYAAFGISGSSQHIFGMKDSTFIISVNTDKNAAIFNHSDICINEDIHEFINTVISKLKKD